MSLVWQSASSVPLAPLPKGGWHGEAVTGGFHAGTFLSNLRRGRRPRRPEPDFSRTPRQGTRALPYKVLRYRARADRVVRPYKQFRRGDPYGRPRAE